MSDDRVTEYWDKPKKYLTEEDLQDAMDDLWRYIAGLKETIKKQREQLDIDIDLEASDKKIIKDLKAENNHLSLVNDTKDKTIEELRVDVNSWRDMYYGATT